MDHIFEKQATYEFLRNGGEIREEVERPPGIACPPVRLELILSPSPMWS
jgi:hypothetical protein